MRELYVIGVRYKNGLILYGAGTAIKNNFGTGDLSGK